MTATDDALVEGDESLTLNGLVADTAVGSVTLTIEDNDMAYTLSGPADSNIGEGESYELTATASSAVQTDTTVRIMRDAAASDAGENDYSVEPILIEAGETTWTTTLMVTDDDLPDGGTGTNRGETLVLFGSVGSMETGGLRSPSGTRRCRRSRWAGCCCSGRCCCGAARCGRADKTADRHDDHRRKLRPADRLGGDAGASRRNLPREDIDTGEIRWRHSMSSRPGAAPSPPAAVSWSAPTPSAICTHTTRPPARSCSGPGCPAGCRAFR